MDDPVGSSWSGRLLEVVKQKTIHSKQKAAGLKPAACEANETLGESPSPADQG
jgi:hypothetical protein